MNIIELPGCAPTPLASYLKAVAVFRLIAEQLDDEVRAWWDGDRFRIATSKTADEIVDFFLDQYEPSAIANPWGGRSGFHSGSTETAARLSLQKILSSEDKRLLRFSSAARMIQDVIAAHDNRKPDGDEEQVEFILDLRRRAGGPATSWLDAATVVIGETRVEKPSLLGSGGNEGSGSYTSAYMTAVVNCVVRPEKSDRLMKGSKTRDQAQKALRTTLFSDCEAGTFKSDTFGQFIPAAYGSDWDTILMLEGACGFQSSTGRRHDAKGDRWVASPFAVPPTGAGASSSSHQDEIAVVSGTPLPGRGEQWFPLWNQPLGFVEFSHLVREGRASQSRRRARDALSFVQAAQQLGTARGVREFVRYGYVQRNNLATHFAVVLGRVEVADRISFNSSIADDLNAWRDRLRRVAREKNAPARLATAERRLTDALLAALQHVDEPVRWQSVLNAMSDIEAAQLYGAGRQAGPIPRLRPQWATAADDGSAELRLALAFALQRDARRHWVSRENGKLVDGRPDRVMRGRSGVDDCVAVVQRRLVEGAQHGSRGLPLDGRSVFASRFDLARLLAGEVDLGRCMRLARALMALDDRAWLVERPHIQQAPPFDWPDEAWLALRVSLLPRALPDGRAPRADPGVVRRLEAGDTSGAVQIALRRLRAAGITCGFTAATSTPWQARLYAAALAFPISMTTAASFAERLDPASIAARTHVTTETAA